MCKNCDSDSVENEVHFLFICEKHISLREQFLTEMRKKDLTFINLTCLEKIIYLVNSNDSYILNLFCKYIIDCFINRN